ncbi:ribosome recycling factor [Weissella viridescens]|uniref:Ribosome-recycling factor n=2 Tax=Weissella viridescens TaxID=1629 RepID=A0A0R2HCC0_WEIVI|nr:ribosome recycling factor [Weissella viridescens]KRN47085.1 ribosome recycling factor [Weissella viridescens]MBX4172191.1 ribosome recycling factor [Weissella viridescens]MCB6839814.1 ribosome recycling factor [Weissella viridescens]MCB6846546.1 ribosome recycling factor [Weissella viridescens]QOD85626.1 ribosome recycling factor [Weissella viridescens]
MANEIIEQAQDKMAKANDALRKELSEIRAGVANPSILRNVNVDYYGAETPLNQIASISVPEARVLLITPFDKSALKDIEQALFAADLGLTPANDGSVIRLVIPALTEESRKDLAKEVKGIAEKSKVAVRSARRDAMDASKRALKDGDLSEDEAHQLEDDIQKATDAATKQVDEIAADKEKELLTI